MAKQYINPILTNGLHDQLHRTMDAIMAGNANPRHAAILICYLSASQAMADAANRFNRAEDCLHIIAVDTGNDGPLSRV